MKEMLLKWKDVIVAWVPAIVPLVVMLGINVDAETVIGFVNDFHNAIAALIGLVATLIHWISKVLSR